VANEIAALAAAAAMRELICNQFTAIEISEVSHDQAWLAANMGEEIPMVATLAAFPGEMTNKVETWADAAIARFELQRAA